MKDQLRRLVCTLLPCLALACAADPRRVAVVDRIVDGEHATLIVGDPPDLEVIVPLEQLPPEVREGLWLRVELEEGRLASATIDWGETERARERIRSKLEALRQRGRRLE